jgi:hypothetical protein
MYLLGMSHSQLVSPGDRGKTELFFDILQHFKIKLKNGLQEGTA